MSRIIAGAAAGRPLTAVPGTGTRPTCLLYTSDAADE